MSLCLSCSGDTKLPEPLPHERTVVAGGGKIQHRQARGKTPIVVGTMLSMDLWITSKYVHLLSPGTCALEEESAGDQGQSGTVKA